MRSIELIAKSTYNALTAELCMYAWTEYGFESPFGADRSETLINGVSQTIV